MYAVSSKSVSEPFSFALFLGDLRWNDPSIECNVYFSTSKELDPIQYGLSLSDSSRYDVDGMVYNMAFKGQSVQVSELVQALENMYCGPITAEYQHLNVNMGILYCIIMEHI